jgi:hypothetical protein
MSVNEIKYELNQMSTDAINAWLFKMYGQDGPAAYAGMDRKTMINEIARDNAQ